MGGRVVYWDCKSLGNSLRLLPIFIGTRTAETAIQNPPRDWPIRYLSVEACPVSIQGKPLEGYPGDCKSRTAKTITPSGLGSIVCSLSPGSLQSPEVMNCGNPSDLSGYLPLFSKKQMFFCE